MEKHQTFYEDSWFKLKNRFTNFIHIFKQADDSFILLLSPTKSMKERFLERQGKIMWSWNTGYED